MSATIRRLLAEQSSIGQKLTTKLSNDAYVMARPMGLSFVVDRFDGTRHVNSSIFLYHEDVKKLHGWLNEMYGDE